MQYTALHLATPGTLQVRRTSTRIISSPRKEAFSLTPSKTSKSFPGFPQAGPGLSSASSEAVAPLNLGSLRIILWSKVGLFDGQLMARMGTENQTGSNYFDPEKMGNPPFLTHAIRFSTAVLLTR